MKEDIDKRDSIDHGKPGLLEQTIKISRRPEVLL